jgi:secondary thiamine-phosphate synthase enzyme
MTSYTEYLWFNTSKKHEFVNITERVRQAVIKSGIQDGLVLVNPMHITAATYVNDAESGLIHDFERLLEKLAPKDAEYKHNLTGEDNAYAHLWRTLMGHQVTLAITNGNLDLGPWEQIYYAEFDGQRSKRVLIKIVGD